MMPRGLGRLVLDPWALTVRIKKVVSEFAAGRPDHTASHLGDGVAFGLVGPPERERCERCALREVPRVRISASAQGHEHQAHAGAGQSSAGGAAGGETARTLRVSI